MEAGDGVLGDHDCIEDCCDGDGFFGNLLIKSFTRFMFFKIVI